MPPEVTVLTAVRNGARFLPETIASIRAQTVADWEYIIVDDASDDDTAEIVDKEAQSDPRIRLIRRTETRGPYVAANEGLRYATGRYVARIDADDIATPQRLELQIRFMSGHPSLRACGGYHHWLFPSGELSRSPARVPILPGVLRWRLCADAHPVHSSVFVERSALDEIGGYKPLPLAQDWRLWCELSRRGWLGIVPEVVVYRRLHPDQLSVREGYLQTAYALDVAREHIRLVSGEDWVVADVHVLREAVHGRAPQLAAALRILERWAEAWKADTDLSLSERAELQKWTRYLKRRHVVRWAERLPGAGRVVRLGSAGGRVALGVGARVTRPLRRRGPVRLRG